MSEYSMSVNEQQMSGGTKKQKLKRFGSSIARGTKSLLSNPSVQRFGRDLSSGKSIGESIFGGNPFRTPRRRTYRRVRHRTRARPKSRRHYREVITRYY